MGLKFYIGASGSGKSYRLYEDIIAQAMENPHRNYLVVVPESVHHADPAGHGAPPPQKRYHEY